MDAGQERALKRHRGDEKTDKIREHHPSLFFEDGNVVLATESWLFCVHKSILKSYSPVFESLFDLPQPSDSHSDTYLEMPMVFMSGDTDEDVIILLRTIYERKFFHAYRKTDINVILGLLRISTKYEIGILRSDVMQLLKTCYPSYLANFDKLNCDHKQPSYSPLLIKGSFGEELQPDDSFRLLSLALQIKANSILPFLSYTCACFDVDVITSMVTSNALDSTDALTLLVGRHKLIVSYYKSMHTHILQQVCSGCCRSFLARLGESPNWVDMPYGIVNLKDLQACACSDCWKSIKSKVQIIRDEYWKEIPRAFGLGDWESLRE